MGYKLMAELLEELNERTKIKEVLPMEDSLRQKLFALPCRERILIEKSFYKHEWDVGSAAVIRLLSEVDLFNFPLYFSGLESPEEQQNIFNDLLETEHHLLADLLRSSMLASTVSLKIQDVISEGISLLLHDLVENSELVIPNYLNILRTRHLNKIEMNLILKIHLEALFKLGNCSILDALGHQFSWERENVLQKNISLLDIAGEICCDYPQILSTLLSMMIEPKFTAWKYGLALIKFIIWSDPELKSTFKKNISELFNEWIRKKSTFHFHLMMLLGRQLAYSSGPSKADTYYQWYKFQIAEMNYKFKSKDEFQYGVKMLTGLAPLECDLDFLKIHINTAIPAPPYCKIYVTEFKEASKRMESELNLARTDTDIVDLQCNNEVIIID